jgi:hypothetical protein
MICNQLSHVQYSKSELLTRGVTKDHSIYSFVTPASISNFNFFGKGKGDVLVCIIFLGRIAS